MKISLTSSPNVLFSVKVNSDMSFLVSHGDESIPIQQFSAVMSFPNSLVVFSDFLNLLSYLKSFSGFPSPICAAVKILKSYSQSGIAQFKPSVFFFNV